VKQGEVEWMDSQSRFFMNPEQIDLWWPPVAQEKLIAQAIGLVGVTRVRAACWVRLWIYLLVKEQQRIQPHLKPPLLELIVPVMAASCTHREAAGIFYHDREQGSDRAAGMMLDKLAALGLIQKSFDGNTTQITIQPLLIGYATGEPGVDLQITGFDPRCDAIAIANLLAKNYNWMNRNTAAVPQRMVQLLRQWSQQYAVGMRVLRRSDNLNPVGFCLLYPTASSGDTKFFGPPTQGLHFSSMTDVDPFPLAMPGDSSCVSLFVRSWMIEPNYVENYRSLLLQDAQATLRRMQVDFPQLCDMYTLIIHPSYEEMAIALGFQKTIASTQQPGVSWMYLPLDRFLQLDMAALSFRSPQQ
jgi:hypothetical protein